MHHVEIDVPTKVHMYITSPPQQLGLQVVDTLVVLIHSIFDCIKIVQKQSHESHTNHACTPSHEP